MTVQTRDVVVVGSGPAGYTAAIYTARAGLRPLMFEGTELGGALMTTSDVENFPGFDSPVLGPELMGRMRKQAISVGAELISQDVTSLDLTSATKEVRTATGVVNARAIILAMGAATRLLGLPAESWAVGNGLSTCATCDGFFFRDRPVAVVGGGDAALEEAIALSRIASSVTLIHRRRQFRATEVLQERLAEAGVGVLLDTVVVDILGNGELTGITVEDLVNHDRHEVTVEGLFVAIGQDPRNDLVKDQLMLTPTGHVAVTDSTTTSMPGVFACGDLVDATYRQAVTAAASGCQAAIDAGRWLVTRKAV